ncbi:MAG: hypothetical protein V7K50_28410 [Nostoc sp.]|uniref:hypothetical protein n=1 Tax=Nostoc sp. TaxID=1180 RepID=UPI002FF7C207
MSALNLGRVGTPIPQKIWDVFLFVSPLTELYWFKECQTKSIKLTPLQADLTFHVMWKSREKPNPLTPFPTREGGKFKVSLLLGERFRERFSRYREKSDKPMH